MNLPVLSNHLDELLRVRDVRDYPNAVNGLQVENKGEVTKVACAVDACEKVIEQAIKANCDLLIVHHGLFWSGLGPVTGAAYRKLRLCIENNLAVYSVHLPLDLHPELGNNALLCDALGLPKEREPFLESQGQPIGLRVTHEIKREELWKALQHAVNGRVHLAAGGPPIPKNIAVVTGGAGASILEAAAAGIDTFITGEGPHWSYAAAEEAHVNLFYAGHYATETFGVKALGAHLQGKYGLTWEFIDHPSGL